MRVTSQTKRRSYTALATASRESCACKATHMAINFATMPRFGTKPPQLGDTQGKTASNLGHVQGFVDNIVAGLDAVGHKALTNLFGGSPQQLRNVCNNLRQPVLPAQSLPQEGDALQQPSYVGVFAHRVLRVALLFEPKLTQE